MDLVDDGPNHVVSENELKILIKDSAVQSGFLCLIGNVSTTSKVAGLLLIWKVSRPIVTQL